MGYLDFYKGKTVLVTGDCGFKGKWLSRWLKGLGANVIGFDISMRKDIRKYGVVSSTIGEYKPSLVFHLAAQALVLESYKDPYFTFSTNVMGTVNILEAIRNSPTIKAAVIITSDKCYKNMGKLQAYREDDPLGGIDPYSASKSAADIITQSYIRSFKGNVNIASARAGNCVGGGDFSENRIIPDCIRSLKENKPLLLRNPEAIRPWQYALEPLYGYLMLGKMLSHERVGKSYTGAWNFGSPIKNAVSVKELVTTFFEIMGAGEYVLEKNHLHPDESKLLLLNSERALHYLDWQTKLDIRKLLEWTIEDYKNPDMYDTRIQKYTELVR